MWYLKELPEIFRELETGEQGLNEREARQRLKECGLNKLPEAKVDSLAVIFIGQFQSPLIYVLLLASLVVFLMGEIIDGSIILAVLFFNAAVGTIQEGRSQNTLLALKKLVQVQATVVRDKKEIIVSDEDLVPGDIIVLQEGERVPSDSRVIESNNLKIDEAALTGESTPVHKISDTLKEPKLATADQKNMVFKGTYVLSGNGKAIVVATGVQTLIGKISKEIAAIETEIPLKKDIKELSRLIIIIVAAISLILFFGGVVSGKSIKEMFTTVVSLSVATIPEGLPIVMTLVLATGVWRMSKRNALIKKLQAVEALGQASIIAVDKTGTITRNEMVIQKLYVDGKTFEVKGVGYEPNGEIKLKNSVVDPANHKELLLAGKIAAFLANAKIAFLQEENLFRVAGDPTEAAMLVFSQKIGFHKENLEKESPILDEIPFDYNLKYHATAHWVGSKNFVAVVGAPEAVIGLSKNIWRNGKVSRLSEKEKKELEKKFMSMSEDGSRVVAFAQKNNISEKLSPKNINSLDFIGFFGMKDALREEVGDAVKKIKSAGIKIVMITGDHKITAKALARESGIYKEGDIVLTGQEIDLLSDNDLKNKLDKVSVFARVTPEHKLRIINAYKGRGDIIAMTGDGVNDAPSLVAADLGVAMGKIGTEVSKEASDIVLMDDNLKSVVAAVEEGRAIYKTIKKVILYLFSTNWGEVMTITIALSLGYPLPLLPAQIIWLNFVTDGFLDVALAMDPKEEGLLQGNFKKPKRYLIDKLMIQRMMFMGFAMTIGTIFIFRAYFGFDIAKALTMSLTTMAVFQWFNAWNCRHESQSVFKMNLLSNKFLVLATVIVIFLQFLAVYNPFMQSILRTVPLGIYDWGLIILVAASIILVEEVRKFFYRRKSAL